MNMLILLKIIIFLSDASLTFSENDTLDFNATAINNIWTSKISINRTQLNKSKAMDYLYSNSEIYDNYQNLDISVFEPEEVKRIFETAQAKGELMEREFNKSRRWYYTHLFIPGPYYITKSLDFMRQSIYGTRYRLQDTRYLRRFLAEDVGYRIAVLYGSLMQLRIKMDNIYTSLYKFDREVKFLWHIVLYERCLAATVDANYMVERIFALHKQSQHKKAEELGVESDYNQMPPPSSGKFQPQFPSS